MQTILATTTGDSTNEGWLATWITGHVDRAHVVDVMENEGFGKCIGAADPLLSLKDACRTVIDQMGMKQRGAPIDVKNLDRSSVGCCAVREIRGVRQNQYPMVFSCALLDHGNGVQRVEFLEINPEQAPDISANRGTAELMLNAAYFHYQSLMQPTHLTNALAKMLRQFHAVRIKEGVYFLPGKFTETFDKVISQIESHPTNEAQFTTLKWSLTPDSRSFKAVITAVKDEIELWKNGVHRELGEMQTKGIKMRSDGLETRLRDCVEKREFLKLYEEMVGALPNELHETITATEAAIANYGMLAMATA